MKNVNHHLAKTQLEAYEDGQWQSIAQERESTFSHKDSLAHDEVWKPQGCLS